jgi:hypothetical protein
MCGIAGLIDRSLTAQPEALWRGHSDTEVLVGSVASRGRAAAIKSLNGMDAMAPWDRRERVLNVDTAAWSHGPLLRFVAGSGYASRTLVKGPQR